MRVPPLLANLFRFSIRRSPPAAFGFYVAWFLLNGAANFALALLQALLYADATPAEAFRTGHILGLVWTVLLAVAVLRANGMLTNVPMVAVALLSLAGWYLIGTILSFVPIAFLTTRPPRSAVPDA